MTMAMTMAWVRHCPVEVVVVFSHSLESIVAIARRDIEWAQQIQRDDALLCVRVCMSRGVCIYRDGCLINNAYKCQRVSVKSITVVFFTTSLFCSHLFFFFFSFKPKKMSLDNLTMKTRLGDISASLSPEWFTQLVCATLKQTNVAVNTTLVNTAFAQLGEEMAASPASPFDYHAELEHRLNNPHTVRDKSAWQPHFGSGEDDDVHVAGLAAVARGNGVPMTQRHAIVVRSDAGHVGKELHAWVLSHPDATVGELIHSPQYQMASDYAHRNALRVAATIAASLTAGHPGTLVPCEVDRRCANYAQCVRNDGSSAPTTAPALLVRPTIHVVANNFTRAQGGGGGGGDDAVLYHRDSTSMHTPGAMASIGGEMRTLLFVDACNGFALRQADPVRQSIVPVQQLRRYATQDVNSEFFANKEDTLRRQAWSEHVRNHYITRQGQVPSSNSRAFWHIGAAPNSLRATDIPLTPIKFFIHGKQARSVSSSSTMDKK
jgi:hypothetical protein